MFQYIIVLLAAVLPIIVRGIPIVPCENGRPPLVVHIENCPTTPCIVTNGSIFPFQVEWIASASSQILELDVYANVFGLSLPLPIDDLSVCDMLVAGSCPVTVGQALAAVSNITISTPFTGGIPVEVEITIKYDNGDISACALVDIELY